MILVDANLLVYAKFSDLPQHARARTWLETRLNAPGKVGIPWQSLLAYLRLSTNARLFARPLSSSAAWQDVESWLDHPRVFVPEPTADHGSILGKLVKQSNATGNLIPDANLAAIAIAHGLTVCSTDSDFARFQDVDWLNPLVD